MNDIVEHPPHYRQGGIEAIDVIEAFGLGFHLGNTVKYVLRAGRKDEALTDLRKGRWYLNRELQRLAGIEPLAGNDLSLLARYRLCYLATPYTRYRAGIEAAFMEAANLAADLLRKGVCCYSPIAHTHPIAVHGGLDATDHSVWLPFDERMMDAACALIVARMPGWHESRGVRHEIDVFAREGKPIWSIDPATLAVEAFEAARQQLDRQAGSAA